MSVRSWPTYLLRDIPEATRAALEEDAALNERSLAETMREILCAHYGLDCEAVESLGRPPDTIKGTDTMILRVQPALFAAIKQDAGKADTHYGTPRGAMREIILKVLADHYEVGVT